MIRKPNLKPCPCCGSEEIHNYIYDPFDGYQGDCSKGIVECLECGLKMEKPTMIEAISDWNRRV